MKQRMVRVLLALGIIGGSVIAVWWVFLYCMQDRLMFPVDMTPGPLTKLPSPEIEVFKHDLPEGGHVEAWLFPARATNSNSRSPAVVFFHGNAELIDYQRQIIQGYQPLGVAVLLVEYRGYGRSGGTPSSAAIRDDAAKFYDQLIQRSYIDPERIIFHGRSLGGGLAAALASLRPPAAMVLESTFQNTDAIAHRFLAPGWFVSNPMHTDQVLAAANFPVLIFHGLHDNIIPVHHGRGLRDAASDAVYHEFDCQHNDFPGSRNIQTYWTIIHEFLTTRGLVQPANSP